MANQEQAESGVSATHQTRRCIILRFKDVRLPPPEYVKVDVSTRDTIMQQVASIAECMEALTRLGVCMKHYQERALSLEPQFDQMRALLWEDSDSTGTTFESFRWLTREESDTIEALDHETTKIAEELTKAKDVALHTAERLRETKSCVDLQPKRLRAVKKHAHSCALFNIIAFASDPQAWVQHNLLQAEKIHTALAQGRNEDALQHLLQMYRVESDKLSVEHVVQNQLVVEVFAGGRPADQERAALMADDQKRFRVVSSQSPKPPRRKRPAKGKRKQQ